MSKTDMSLIRPLILLTILGAAAGVPTEAHSAPPRGHVGAIASAFDLETLDGHSVRSKRLRGHRIVLVVGTTQGSAPRCKRWMEPLLRDYPPKKSPVEVFQVVVVDKAWYLPKSLVRSKLEGFVGKAFHDRFLIEWKTAFGTRYGVPRSSLPVVLLIDKSGVIRWRLRDTYTKARYLTLRRAIDGPAAASQATTRQPHP